MMRASAKEIRTIENTVGALLAPRISTLSTSFLSFSLLLLGFLSAWIPATPTQADPAYLALYEPVEPAHIRADRTLDDLLEIPSLNYVWVPESTDDALAAAVRLGNEPGLEPLNPFRKRKFDLFRTEHPFEIGENEMLFRLRVRAKMSKAVSLELHF